MIKIENVSKTYKHRRGAKVEALDGITFDLPDKGMVFILGPSGSGKSTLLNILGGLDDFDGGDVVFKGKSFKNFNEHDRNAYRNSVCGFVFQEYCLIPELNVTDNVKITAQLKGAKNAAESAEKALNLVGLQDFASRKVTELSGGQSQRVAIARAIAKNPEIIFADEPTGALDETTGKDILTLLKGLSRDRLVIAVSHDRKFAEEFGDRIIELADGKIKSDSDGSYRDEPRRTGSARAEDLNSPKLPLKTALRLGCGNLLRRPARTAITILLSATAFALTGLTISARPDGLEGLISADAVRTIADAAAAAGGIFAAFSMALMLNLMWQSAADRIKTIGILKACGAGSGLPAAMFACEAGITGLAAYAAAAAALLPLCGLANRYVLGDRADTGMTAFAPGLHAPCALLALAVAFILIGCALPAIKAAVLRPADMLREE